MTDSNPNFRISGHDRYTHTYKLQVSNIFFLSQSFELLVDFRFLVDIFSYIFDVSLEDKVPNQIENVLFVCRGAGNSFKITDGGKWRHQYPMNHRIREVTKNVMGVEVGMHIHKRGLLSDNDNYCSIIFFYKNESTIPMRVRNSSTMPYLT